jgi:hypothetical protein
MNKYPYAILAFIVILYVLVNDWQKEKRRNSKWKF